MLNLIFNEETNVPQRNRWWHSYLHHQFMKTYKISVNFQGRFSNKQIWDCFLVVTIQW